MIKPGTLVRLNDKAVHARKTPMGDLWVIKENKPDVPDLWEAKSLATGEVYLWYEWEFEHEEG